MHLVRPVCGHFQRGGRSVEERKRAAPRDRPLATALLFARCYCRRDRTDAGAWLAWASIAWPAWARIEYFVYCTISDAMSTSRIRLSAAIRFSWYAPAAAGECPGGFWIPPSVAR